MLFRSLTLACMSLSAVMAADPVPAAVVNSVNAITGTAARVGIDGTVDISVNFSQTVNINPHPATTPPSLELQLDSEITSPTVLKLRTALLINPDTIFPRNALTFRYTVQAGDTSSKLRYRVATALASGSSAFYTAQADPLVLSVPVTLTLPTPGSANSLDGSTPIVVDTTAPVVTSLTTTVNGGQVYGAPFDIVVNFNEPIATLSDTTKAGLSLRLNTGGYATFKSQAGSTITLTYTPQVGEESFLLNAADDGISTTESGRLLIPVGGGVTDTASPGNPAIIWVPTQGKPGALSESRMIQVPVGGQLAKPLPKFDATDNQEVKRNCAKGGVFGVILMLSAWLISRRRWNFNA